MGDHIRGLKIGTESLISTIFLSIESFPATDNSRLKSTKGTRRVSIVRQNVIRG